MRILVLSDSHFRSVELDLKSFDYVIHCGDYGKFKSPNSLVVRGNCDFRNEKEIVRVINNRKVYITHGDLYDVKYSYNRLVYRALELEANVCFFGHTHRADIFINEGILFINPGAYQDGYYVIIEKDKILLYKDNNCYKEIDFVW